MTVELLRELIHFLPHEDMIVEFLRELIHSLPYLAWLCWMGLLIYENRTAYPKIVADQSKYDPEHVFVRKTNNSMYLSSNRFWVDKNHPRCTPEFLLEWDQVYGKHWRKIYFIILACVPLFGLGAQFLRYVLLKLLPI